MRKLIPASALFMLILVGGCTTDVVNTAQVYNPIDSMQEYVQRADSVTLSAGNAQAVNTRIHENDPWPRNVGNRRIAANGQRMADAMWRYRCEKNARAPLVPITTGETTTTTTSSGSVALLPPGTECSSAGATQGR